MRKIGGKTSVTRETGKKTYKSIKLMLMKTYFFNKRSKQDVFLHFRILKRRFGNPCEDAITFLKQRGPSLSKIVSNSIQLWVSLGDEIVNVKSSGNFTKFSTCWYSKWQHLADQFVDHSFVSILSSSGWV